MKEHNQKHLPCEKENDLRFILRQLMISAGLSHAQLARALNIPTSTLSKLLNAPNLAPRIDTLLSIARYFNISIEQLIGEKPLDSSEFKEILPQPKRKSEWQPELYLECAHMTCELITKKKYKVSAEHVLEMIKEIYFYSLHQKNGKLDNAFVEWFISRSLK